MQITFQSLAAYTIRIKTALFCWTG